MAIGGSPVVFHFRDGKGWERTVKTYLAQANLADWAADVVFLSGDFHAISNSATKTQSDGTSVGVGVTGPGATGVQPWTAATNAQFETVFDKAVLIFNDADGRPHRFQVPAPKSSIFLADLWTIDKTNGAMKQIIADFTFTTFLTVTPQTHAPLQTAQGINIVSWVSGFRKAPAKASRRANSTILDPTLGIPAL